jgi:hypothetical protein
MKNLIEFKLHGGKIPYFVSAYLNGISINNKCYGISCEEGGSDYLPETIKKLTLLEFIAVIKSIKIEKPNIDKPDFKIEVPELMSEEEKEIFILNWLVKNGWTNFSELPEKP